MIGVVVATHGRLAEELLRAAEGICGELPQCRAMTLSAASAMNDAREALGEHIADVDQGDGVLVLTDMFGGTPANLALTFLDERIEVVTGVNLPMIMKLATCRGPEARLEEVAKLVANHGQKNITLASELLRARSASPAVKEKPKDQKDRKDQ
jgi:PTS system mannose-specific IIA component